LQETPQWCENQAPAVLHSKVAISGKRLFYALTIINIICRNWRSTGEKFDVTLFG